MASNKLNTQLNELVATWSVLYTKLHNYHWYVTGNQFFTLHAKFEELYNEVTLNLDEVAERILTKGGKPVATLREHLELSHVQEATGSETPEEMVQTTINDFKAIMKLIKEAMRQASEDGDDRTEDMLNATFQSLEKHSWMLNAFLGK
ncbi:DNA-binding ferritin-like protein [Rhizophagus irregularis]|uniref:DNA-binding ferritin-like protein n=2 Tax=cellular organisms TaxID=131567 RepID=A0A2N0QM26_9GLOM|nr:DNA starvation/stationary phase protection protein [Ureibacillus massiliensis]KGR88811.1 general stress protein [Ureibacillus massiliensis 4400831 = CIP 108448 = CCUG 49529]PKC52103.1 DNA-binding ferritin-like protein [Rhizophagus irregularis]RKJ28243.1 DNA starvation/stationary phase protection protein [Butyricicoccus sp. 1XD8-22]